MKNEIQDMTMITKKNIPSTKDGAAAFTLDKQPVNFRKYQLSNTRNWSLECKLEKQDCQEMKTELSSQAYFVSAFYLSQVTQFKQ